MGESENQTNGACGQTRRRPFPLKKRRVLVAMVIVAGVVLGAMPLEICRDCAFICENTGSQKGYRQWSFGPRTGDWYRKSGLEEFMLSQHPTQLKYHWTSCEGTGKNVFGRSISFGHAFPVVGPGVMNQTWFNSYVDTLDDTAKLDLYRVLASGNHDAIMAEEKKIEEVVLRNAGSK